jgi:adhesin/invasin
MTCITFCGDDEILAPNTATLTLVVNPSSIPADGQSTATVEAILQDDTGQPIHGVTIWFSTTLGTITERAEVEDGIARATLTAGEEEGTATIRAFSGSLSDTAQVLIGFQNVNIFLTANPPEIPADGVSTSRIEAFVNEEQGLVPDGTNVYFTTTLGSITSQSETQSGFATATLTSGITEGSATITAIVSNTSQTIEVSVGIPVSNITLTANPSIFEVTTAETQTHVSELTVTVWNAAGVPIENKAVIITSDRGQLDSGGSVQKTDENGQVKDTIRITIAVPQGTSQSVTVTATSGSISATTTITIINQG